MKKIILAVFLLLNVSLLSLTAFAQSVCKYSIAKVTCGAGIVSNVFAAGWAELNGTTVTNSTTVEGFLKAYNVNLNTVSANGMVTINNSTIKGFFHFRGDLTVNGLTDYNKLEMVGILDASNSSFDDIEITSEKSYLSSTSTKNIVEHMASNHHEKIYLRNNSVVNGDISFDSGNGEVVVSGGSRVMGAVRGGRIINNN